PAPPQTCGSRTHSLPLGSATSASSAPPHPLRSVAPRGQGGLASPCFHFSVATHPLMLCLLKYRKFCSEQYPVSASTSCGFCPLCSSIFSIIGTNCCLSLASGVTVCPTIN